MPTPAPPPTGATPAPPGANGKSIPTKTAPKVRTIPDQSPAALHAQKTLRVAARNLFAAIHLSASVPVEQLRDAIYYTLDERMKTLLDEHLQKLDKQEAALWLATLTAAFHSGYSMGHQEAGMGRNWHAELEQRANG